MGQDLLHFKLHSYILGLSFYQKDLQRGDGHIFVSKDKNFKKIDIKC
jgi:hypothetical protein